jgi:5-methyltetrahydropteroyltriglutamate--homocysteine methyltransferase
MADLKTIRSDVVGSLLRPPGLREERIRFDEGQISAEAMRALEDEAVRGAVRLQESVGLDVISDGEVPAAEFPGQFWRRG